MPGLKLHNFPGWRDKLLKYLMEEFDADAGQVVAMADLTEKFNLATDDESGEWAEDFGVLPSHRRRPRPRPDTPEMCIVPVVHEC